MSKISEMKPKELRIAKAELVEALAGTIRPSRITNVTETGCILEGGCLCATFKVGEGLTVWGTARKYSGSSVNVSSLQMAEKILAKWFKAIGGDYA